MAFGDDGKRQVESKPEDIGSASRLTGYNTVHMIKNGSIRRADIYHVTGDAN